MTNHSALWDKLADLARIHGAAIADRSELWVVRAGPWTLTANGAAEPVCFDSPAAGRHTIPARAIFVQYRGAPAGLIDAERADISGGGRNATAYALLCALREHIYRQQRPRR